MKDIKLYNTEEFKIEKQEKKGENKVILKGNAMPLNETSRNGVYYRPESVKKAYKSLEGKPFLFAHQQDEVRHILGKVEKVNQTNDNITYEADIDPEEKEFIRKSEKGYIKSVSVGVMIDPDTIEIDEEKGTAQVDITEFVELSSAPIPGFQSTSGIMQKQVIQLAEKLGNEKQVEKLKSNSQLSGDDPESSSNQKDKDEDEPKEPKETKETDDEDEKPNDKDTEKPKEPEDKKETDDEEPVEDKMQELNSKVEEVFGKIEELENTIAVLQSKVDTLLDDEEDEEKEPEKDKDDEEDEDEEETKETQDDKDDDKDDKEEEVTKKDVDKIELDDKEEKFEEKHTPKQTKKELDNKEKELKSKEKNPIAVDMEKTIKSNKKY